MAVRLFVCWMRLKEQRELRQQFDWIDCPDEIFDLLHDAGQAFSSFLRSLYEIGNGLWVLRRKRSRHVGEAISTSPVARPTALSNSRAWKTMPSSWYGCRFRLDPTNPVVTLIVL